jgi:hypothetical protein
MVTMLKPRRLREQVRERGERTKFDTTNDVLQFRLREGHRRGDTGHMRANLLTILFLGLSALYGSLWTSSIPVPKSSIVIALSFLVTALVFTLAASRPYIPLWKIIWMVICPPRRPSRADKEKAFKDAQTVSDQAYLREVSDDVVFFKWGVMSREARYAFSGLLELLSIIYILIEMARAT